LSQEQVEYCEKRFGDDSEVLQQMEFFEYSQMILGQRIVFWQVMVKDYLLKTHKFIVPGTEPKVVTKESILEEEERRKKNDEEYERNLALAIYELKSFNIRRIYMAETYSTNRTCSVLDALPPVKNRCKFPTIAGRFVEVKYEAEFANYKAVEFSDTTVGLYTSGMGDCIGVMFLIGKIGKGTPFTHGSLAHLPGGNSHSLNWKQMVFNLTPTELRDALQVEVLYAQALICVTPARLSGSRTVYNLIKNEILPLGFNFPQIMVYIGDIPGFKIHKNGCFGVINTIE
jgi:hypothetical protein